jgi:hypothetical protein
MCGSAKPREEWVRQKRPSCALSPRGHAQPGAHSGSEIWQSRKASGSGNALGAVALRRAEARWPWLELHLGARLHSALPKLRLPEPLSGNCVKHVVCRLSLAIALSAHCLQRQSPFCLLFRRAAIQQVLAEERRAYKVPPR